MSRRLGYAPATSQDFHTPQCQQFGFDYGTFGPRQHLENLHPYARPGSLRKGVVAFAQRRHDADKSWKEWTAPAGSAAVDEAVRLLRQDNRADIYVSQAAFEKWRSISQITAIGACYADLDYHTRARWRGKAPRDVAAAVVGLLEEAMIPHPSYILSTGRGLVCVWLTELLPRAVLPRWNAVQKRLGTVLEPFGADKRALDAARVFRLVGSENSRADRDRRTVGMVWCHGSPEAPARHVFSTLADEALPVTHAELVSLRAERARRKAEGKDKTGPAVYLSAATYWETVLTDLQRLRAHRHGRGLPEGQRDAWLFVAGVAMSWISPPEVLGREIIALAHEAAGWRTSETKSRMSAVIKRARQAAAGQTVTFGGHEVDCRYRMKASTIVEWLRIDPAEQRAAGLRVLVDEDRKGERSVERMEQSRRRRGVKDRREQQAARLEMGRKALYLRSAQGMTRDDLAAHFGVSAGQISKAMREAGE
ncbi:hypothetical protein HJA87_06235 [Rhizobium bangladeshense]|uniref:Replication protein n=1 Tax=Rhizobium bangladeshense TaxID=1138189 RepID=A0ABS7LDD6_9HYPH|nr:hypothetical protein [Rhizobium bangladeshense]MBY3589482.1 hypothetical protein [Rhizobium bangladeshense]